MSTVLYLLGVINCWYLDYMKDRLLSLHIQVGKLTSVTTLLTYPAWYKTTGISHQTNLELVNYNQQLALQRNIPNIIQRKDL